METNLVKKNKSKNESETRSRSVSNGMEAKIYNQNGKEAGTISLPEGVFGLPWNSDLVHQVTTGMMSNARAGTAHTKDRGAVRGGGKKPWKQKGTGRARHGSIRSPIWVGGGVTHGPKSDKNYDKKINKKMRAKALLTILSRKYKDGEVLFIDKLEVKGKTADAAKIMKNLGALAGFERLAGSMKKKTANVVIPAADAVLERSFSNLANAEMVLSASLNALNAANRKYLIVVSPEEFLKSIAGKSK